MKKNLIILTEWKDEKQFHQLKFEVENNLNSVDSFTYLVWINKAKDLDVVPKAHGVNYLTKKSFSFFGKLKDKGVNSMLKKNNTSVLVVALEKNKPFIKRILKRTSLTTIGLENESLLKFDVSFAKTTLKGGEFFKKLDKYLTKIQL